MNVDPVDGALQAVVVQPRPARGQNHPRHLRHQRALHSFAKQPALRGKVRGLQRQFHHQRVKRAHHGRKIGPAPDFHQKARRDCHGQEPVRAPEGA